MGTSRLTCFTVDSQRRLDLFISDCGACGTVFGITTELEERRRRDHDTFWCPNGHKLHFSGDSDAEKLKAANARLTAMKDQVNAAVRDAETARAQLLRDRQRFANGVCPCCDRSFGNVRRHMETEHPEFPAKHVVKTPVFKCSCGYVGETFHGLRTHQGHRRADGWDNPNTPAWRAHLTKV